MAARSEIASVSDLLSIVAGVATGVHAHVRYWFRGHGRDEWKLHPGVYRPTFRIDDLSEESRLLAEQHINQDFRVLSAGIRSGNEGDAELYFLQQHYGLPTRLLDWSTIPLTALYFAVCDPINDEVDGELIILDAYDLGVTQKGMMEAEQIGFKGIVTSRTSVFMTYLDVITSFLDPGDFPPFIIPVRPDHFDRRVALQQGCFTFHPSTARVLTAEHSSTLMTAKILRDRKPSIRKELSLLGVNDFTVYGDLDHLATRLKAAYLKL